MHASLIRRDVRSIGNAAIGRPMSESMRSMRVRIEP